MTDINNIKEVAGWLGTNLNITNEELENIINNIKTKEEIESLPDFISKYMSKELIDNLFKNEFYENISSEFIKNIPQNTFLSLDYKTLNKLTDRQIYTMDINNFYYLNNNSNLLYLNDDALLTATNRIDFTTGYYDTTIPKILTRMLLSDKLKNIGPDKISEINKDVLPDIDHKILNSLTVKQISNMSQETKESLISNRMLQNFSVDVIKHIGQDVNFNYANAANALTFNLFNKYNFENISTQVSLLCDKDKIHLLSEKSLSTLDKHLVVELKKQNINKLSAPQLNSIKNNIKYIDVGEIDGINTNVIKDLDDDFFSNITEEQIDKLNIDHITSLIKENKLHLLKSNNIKTVVENNFNPEFLSNLTVDDLSNQINCFNDNFFNFIKTENVINLNSEIIKNINIQQFKSIKAEQLEALYEKNNDILNDLPDNCLSTIENDEFYKLNDTILKNIETKHISTINDDKINYLLKNNKLILLDKDVIKLINNRINFSKINIDDVANDLNELNKQDKLDALSVDAVSSIPIDKISSNLENETLENIGNLNLNTKTYKDENVEETEEVLDTNIIDKYDIKDNGHLESKDFKYAISNYIQDEDYQKLQNNCIEWFKNKSYRNDIIEALHSQLDDCKNNIYGEIDKIEILKLLTLVETEEKKNIKNYSSLEQTIKNLKDTKAETIDGHISKIKEFSKIIREDNFDKDFLEMMAQENIKNIDKCINSYYSKIERNSLDTGLKDLYANVLIDYANVISQKYNIDMSKFEKQLDEHEEINLTKEERLYFNTIKKAFEYKPDIESTVKSWVTPILKTAIKTAGAYFGTQATATATQSTVLTVAAGVAGAGIVASDIIDQYDKKNYFLNPESYHKTEREKEDGVFKQIWKGTKTTAYYGLAYWWLKPAQEARKMYRKYKGYEEVGFDNDKRKKTINLKSNSFKKNIIKEYFNKTKEYINKKHNKDFKSMDKKLSVLAGKENKLIKDFMAIKEKAIDIRMKKELAKLYTEYPEFNESGVLNKLLKIKDVTVQTGKGVLSSIFDIATLGYGSDFYNTYIDGKHGEEKLENEAKLKKFKAKLNQIDKSTCDKLNELRKEKVRRLSALNSKDSALVEVVDSKQNQEMEKLENDFSNFLLNNKFKNKLYDFYELSNVDDISLKIDNRIVNKINKENGLLNGVEKLSKDSKNLKKDFDTAYNQLISLASKDDIDSEILANNVDTMLQKSFEMTNSGYLNFEDVKMSMVPLLAIAKTYENSSGKEMSKLVNENYKEVKKSMDTKFVDLIEKKSSLDNSQGMSV